MKATETNIEEMTAGLLALVSHYPNSIFVKLQDALYENCELDDNTPEFNEASKAKVKTLLTELFGLIKKANEGTGNQS